jgi:hypothetical protein
VLAAPWARAQVLDHAGEVGVRAAAVGEFASTVNFASQASGYFSYYAGGIELGPTTWFDDEGDELSLRARWIPRAIQSCESSRCDLRGEVAFLAGVRKFAGRDEFKTFLDADLVLSVAPAWLAGLHLAAGLLWDVCPGFGAYASLGALAELGGAFHFDFEATVGFQIRFHVVR